MNTTPTQTIADVLATFAGVADDVITCHRIRMPLMMPAVLHVNCRSSGSAQVSWVYLEESGESGWLTSAAELECEIVRVIGHLQGLNRNGTAAKPKVGDYLQTYGATASDTVTTYEIPLPPGCYPHSRLTVEHSTAYHWLRVSWKLGFASKVGTPFDSANVGRLDADIREAFAALRIPPTETGTT